MILLAKFENYKDVLRDALNKRVERNSSYSLRAFARDLKMSPSRLSEILKLDQDISPASAKKIATSLFDRRDDREFFLDLVISQVSTNQKKKELADIRINRYRRACNYNELRENDFKVIEDWYHLAIIELTYLDHFESSTDWIAEKLNLSYDVVTEALSRLEALDLIFIDEDEIKLTHQRNSIMSECKSESIRSFHRQMIQLALNSIEDQETSERDLSAMMLAIDQSRLPEIKEKIQKFRRELSADIDSSHDHIDEIYALNIQFFKLSSSETIR